MVKGIPWDRTLSALAASFGPVTLQGASATAHVDDSFVLSPIGNPGTATGANVGITLHVEGSLRVDPQPPYSSAESFVEGRLFLSTATLSFVLPPKVRIESAGGFSEVPEPGTLALAGLGALALSASSRRRSRVTSGRSPTRRRSRG